MNLIPIDRKPPWHFEYNRDFLEGERQRALHEAERSQRLAEIGRRLDRCAESFCWSVFVFAAGLFAGSVISAWLRGAFEAVIR